MKVYIAICPIGIFAINENNKIIKSIIFQKDPEKVAKTIYAFEMGEQIPELVELIEKLTASGITDIETTQPNQASKFLSEKFREIALKEKIFKDNTELNLFLSKLAIVKSKLKISKLERRDKLIIQAVSSLIDLDKILNLMSERLREWYGIHYPELKINEHKKFAEFIVKYGRRENDPNFKTSMGMEIDEKDENMLKIYAEKLKEMFELRDEIEKYLREICKKEIPNTSAIVGPIIAARLLAHAGSLEKLAKMSASTIQLLGAEKALFKFLREREKKKGAKPPKYGLLYLVPEINSAPKEKKGKIARIFASELILAIRADYFSKVDKSEEFIKNLKEKLEKVK
ncbi:MAG: hypothetical protein QW469_03510 [Candidatus Aenigmatarchaeota archaeon]